LKADELWSLLSAHRDLRRNTRLTRQELQAKKITRFRRLVRFVNNASPYYASIIRDHGIRLETCVPEDFPVLTKSALVENYDQIVTDRRITHNQLEEFLRSSKDSVELYLGEYVVTETSGSTGEKAFVVYHRRDWARAMAQSSRFPDTSYESISLRRRRVAYCGAIVPHFGGVTMCEWWKHSIARFFLDYRFFELNRPIDVNIAELNAFRPDNLIGLTTSLKILGEQRLSGALRISPMHITVGGEMVTEADQAFLSHAFGCKVVSMYATSEHLTMGRSHADDTRMILYDDDVIYEFQKDHILTTNLVNSTMPLIRYRMSDVIEPSAQQPEDTPYLRINSLIGRFEMWLRFLNERGIEDVLAPMTLSRPTTRGLLGSQIQVVSNTEFLLRARFHASMTQEERDHALADLRPQVASILRQKGMSNVAFDIEAVDELPVDPATGKFKLVVR
jgi:phenylacetate-coenzyme A ligase PaaK-like adenylate-forming protein